MGLAALSFSVSAGRQDRLLCHKGSLSRRRRLSTDGHQKSQKRGPPAFARKPMSLQLETGIVKANALYRVRIANFHQPLASALVRG